MKSGINPMSTIEEDAIGSDSLFMNSKLRRANRMKFFEIKDIEPD